MSEGVLLDTSFFLRFLNDKDPLFNNADGYFRYFLDRDISMFISTISVAEFCVGGSVDQLPLKNLKILPFNLEHSKRAGVFAGILFQERVKSKIVVAERILIPNDAKLFAQADTEANINYYLTSDSRSLDLFRALKNHSTLKFNILEIKNDHTQTFGLLNL